MLHHYSCVISYLNGMRGKTLLKLARLFSSFIEAYNNVGSNSKRRAFRINGVVTKVKIDLTCVFLIRNVILPIISVRHKVFFAVAGELRVIWLTWHNECFFFF